MERGCGAVPPFATPSFCRGIENGPDNIWARETFEIRKEEKRKENHGSRQPTLLCEQTGLDSHLRAFWCWWGGGGRLHEAAAAIAAAPSHLKYDEREREKKIRRTPAVHAKAKSKTKGRDVAFA